MATVAKKLNLKKSSTTTKPVLKTKKIVKVSKAETDEKNLKGTVTKIVESRREVKYIYPEGMVGDQLKMKAHRTSLRLKDKKFTSEIAEAERLKKAKEVESLKKAYRAFRKENYLVP